MIKLLLKSLFIWGIVMPVGALGEGNPPAFKIVPIGVRVNYQDVEDYMGKGIDVAVLFEREGVESVFIQGESKDTLILKDSNNRYLGPCAGTSGGKPCYFLFEKLPSPGAKWLHLKGELSIEYWLEKEASPFVPLKLDREEEATTGAFNIKITDLKDSSMEGFRGDREPDSPYKYSVSLEVSFKKDAMCFFSTFGSSIKLTDTEGKEIDFKAGGGGGSISSTHEAYHINCLFTERPDEVNISIQYNPVVEETLNVDLKYDLYPKDED